MTTALLAGLLFFSLQDPPTVPVGKSDAAPYRAALKKYQDAQKALDSGNVTEAFDLSSDILNDTKIKIERRECLIKIQNNDSTWELPAEFFPVKVHAAALMEKAKRLLDEGKKEDAVAKLQAASKELEESVARNVPGGKDVKAAVQKLIDENPIGTESPEQIKKRKYEAKLTAGFKALNEDDLAAAKRLFQEAIAIDDTKSDAKDGLAKVEFYIEEEGEFGKLKAMKDDSAKLAAYDAFLKKYEKGRHAPEVRGARAKLDATLNASVGEQYNAKLNQARSAMDAGKFEEAKGLFEEAIRIDGSRPEAKDGLKRVEAALAEEVDFAKLSLLADNDDKIAACEGFIRKYPSGRHKAEVENKRRDLIDQRTARAEKLVSDFLDAYGSLRDAQKFKSALAHLQKGDSPLKPEQTKDLETKIRAANDRFVTNAINTFRGNLADLDTVDALAAKSAEDLNRDFAVPEEAELIASSPVLAWCRDFRRAMEAIRALGPDPAAGAVIDLMRDGWRGAPSLVDKGENSFFKSLAGWVRERVEQRLAFLVQQSKKASGEELKKLREEASGLLAKVEDLDGRLTEGLKGQPDGGKAWRETHAFWGKARDRFKGYLDQFPIEVADIDVQGAKLVDWEKADGVYGKSPVAALQLVEETLKSINRKQGANLSRDNKRRLYTYATIAAAMRLLLDGNKAEEAARQIEYGPELQAAGGPLMEEVKKFGPKVEKVFAELAK